MILICQVHPHPQAPVLVHRVQVPAQVRHLPVHHHLVHPVHHLARLVHQARRVVRQVVARHHLVLQVLARPVRLVRHLRHRALHHLRRRHLLAVVHHQVVHRVLVQAHQAHLQAARVLPHLRHLPVPLGDGQM